MGCAFGDVDSPFTRHLPHLIVMQEMNFKFYMIVLFPLYFYSCCMLLSFFFFGWSVFFLFVFWVGLCSLIVAFPGHTCFFFLSHLG